MTSAQDTKLRDRFALALGCFVLGAFTDFVFNGILKIVWIAIYGLCYVTIGTTLNAYLAKTRFFKNTRLSMTALLLGALAGHLAMAGHQFPRNYSMRLVSNPFENASIALKAEELTETLYISSEKLQQKLSQKSSAASQEPIPVTVRVTFQYGCIQKIVVDRVDGIAINSDPAASWTWKIDRDAPTAAEPLNLGWGDEKYFWCHKSS
jgi:hypothetical protein